MEDGGHDPFLISVTVHANTQNARMNEDERMRNPTQPVIPRDPTDFSNAYNVGAFDFHR